MTTAKITAKLGYRCAPNGHTVKLYPFGEIVTGQVADWALSEGDAKRMFDPRDDAKVVTDVETKAAPRKRRATKKKAADK
jgi:hypothetical protein